MWTRTTSIVTKAVTKEQIWKVFTDVNTWHIHDEGIEYAKLEGKFEKGNSFILKPKGGPKVKVYLTEVIQNKKYTDVTRFPLAKMTDEHILEETPEGLKFTNIIYVKGILSFLWIKLVAKKIANDMPSDMERVIKRASTL